MYCPGTSNKRRKVRLKHKIAITVYVYMMSDLTWLSVHGTTCSTVAVISIIKL